MNIAKLLLEQPAVKVNKKDNSGWTALHYAVKIEVKMGICLC